jgi:hypothetical protein
MNILFWVRLKIVWKRLEKGFEKSAPIFPAVSFTYRQGAQKDVKPD